MASYQGGQSTEVGKSPEQCQLFPPTWPSHRDTWTHIHTSRHIKVHMNTRTHIHRHDVQIPHTGT